MKTKNYESPTMETMDVKAEGCLCTSKEVTGFSNETYDMDNISTYTW